MQTLKSISGKKAVNISTEATGTVRAMYVQIYDGQEQVLESKSYKTINKAVKWAQSKLS